MKRYLLYVVSAAQFFLSSSLCAQGIGEYGRAVGGIPRLGPTAPGSAPQVGSGRPEGGGVSEGKGLPIRLMVAAKEAGLYSKQDDESEKLALLAQGEILVPMVQSSGGSNWYMVKTKNGLIGWVKSLDVESEKIKR